MNKGHTRRISIFIFVILIGCQAALPQQSTSIQRTVAAKLRSLKPKNTGEYNYRVVIPSKPVKLPASLRLDLVYKIGHYRWDLVALRFEKKRDQSFVDVSQVVFGSAFPFIKESDGVKDSYSVKTGQLRIEEFNRLLSLAHLLYRANIEQNYIGPRNRMSGSFSSSGSSGDGTILLQLKDPQANPATIIRESGVLHVGNLAERVRLNDYEQVRVHLFWEVFYNYLQREQFLRDIGGAEAVDLLISRLQDPPLVDGYQDYFRQSLYVRVLGELGSPKAISTLEAVGQTNLLEENWSKSLQEDISEAIEKIRGKGKAKT